MSDDTLQSIDWKQEYQIVKTQQTHFLIITLFFYVYIGLPEYLELGLQILYGLWAISVFVDVVFRYIDVNLEDDAAFLFDLSDRLMDLIGLGKR